MATLVFQMAGSAIGGLLGPFGAVAGRALGGLAGAMVDNALFGGSSSSGAKLKDLDVTASTEGTPVPQVYGRGRVAGQIIWATRLEAVTYRRKAAAKGGAMGGGEGDATAYFANIALGLCEGPNGRIGRVWADGKPLDLHNIVMRTYSGSETQEPDPLIVAKEGADFAPAYRGLVYVVFERLNLEPFGNRIPQLSFEVIRAVGELESNIRAVTIIPGAGEFAYDTAPVIRTLGLAASDTENRHTLIADTDWEASLDELQALCPNLTHVSLVAAWFGNDLRAGNCTITPRVDSTIKRTVGRSWRVSNLSREDALEVSSVDGKPSYGGSPSDEAVIAAIRDLNLRGLKVTLYPFIMMDVPAANALFNPYTGSSGQPAYPWRGQITCSPAAGVSGSVDATPAATTQIASFFGTATPAQFSIAGDQVNFSGSEWSFRRFVLHMAKLSVAAGGVDSFIIGSEMPGITRVRSASGVYPATAQLVALAADVRAVVGGTTKLTYAADWTEYGAHVLGGGSEVRFPLDPLWSSANINAVGIDWYAPFADWRDGASHLDALAGHDVYDHAYLQGNVTGGEAYDWYYPNSAARDAQTRSPITDGLGKPWVFRQKDIINWWNQPHIERVGGVELPAVTAWVSQSKPIWLTETGCGAVDKGANAPNVFPDPKSSLNALPFYSNGARDDLMQRRTLEAVIARWDERAPGFTLGSNPVSSVYGSAMLDADRIYLWTWDARPFPAFPQARNIWADGLSHETGHWLTGRLGQVTLSDLCAALLKRANVEEMDSRDLDGVVDGYVIDRIASAREALEPLIELFNIAPFERDGAIVLRQRGKGSVKQFSRDELAVEDKSADPRQVRGQETELPAQFSVGFSDMARDFQTAAVTAARFGTAALGAAATDTALVMDRAEAQKRAYMRLQDLWVGRETISLSISPNELAVEPGDLFRLDDDMHLFEVLDIRDSGSRKISARKVLPEIFRSPRPVSSIITPAMPISPSPPAVLLLDLPVTEGDPPVLTRVAVAASPWPGAVVLWKDAGGSYEPVARCAATAIIGETLDILPAGPVWRWDRGADVTVKLAAGELQSASDERLFAGANLAAIGSGGSDWEIIQFGLAELIGVKTWRLSRLLRGLSGTETKAAFSKAVGSNFILLDNAVQPLISGIDALDRPQNWRAVASSKDPADPFATAFTVTPTNTALKPRAPVHIRAKRVAGNIEISWIRRTRVNGDNWNLVDVPLGENAENYRVEIMDGVTVKRVLTATQQNALYTSAQEIVDFSVAQAMLTVRVRQVSGTVGMGEAGEKTVEII
jgi:hypothetical protein